MSWDPWRLGHYCNRCDVNIVGRQRTKVSNLTTPPPNPHLHVTWFGKPSLQGFDLQLCHTCGAELMGMILKHYRKQVTPVHCHECGKKIEMGAKSNLDPIDHRLCVWWAEKQQPLTPSLEVLTLCLEHGKALEGELRGTFKGKEDAKRT